MRRAAGVAATTVVVLLGCGSSTSSSLFGSGGGTGGTGGTGGSSASGGATGGTGLTSGNGGSATGGSGGATTAPTGGASSGGTSGGSGGASSGGGSASGGLTGAPDSGGPPDAGGSGGGDGGPPPFGIPTPGTVLCAGVDCMLTSFPTNTCCVGAPPFPTGCFPTFPGCVNAVVSTISCDDAPDCANGQACCGNVSGQIFGSACAAACNSPSFQVCRTAEECPGKSCQPVPEAPGYGRCQP